MGAIAEGFVAGLAAAAQRILDRYFEAAFVSPRQRLTVFGDDLSLSDERHMAPG